MQMKIVIYADWLVTYLMSEPFDFCKGLEKYGWILCPLSNAHKLEFNPLEKYIILFVTYKSCDISSFKKENIQIVYKIDDLFPFDEMYRKGVESCDYIIGPYTHLFHKINDYNLNNKPTLTVPYSAVPNYFNEISFNELPIKKVFLSGAMSWEYFLRRSLRENTKLKCYVDVLDHPGYTHQKHSCTNLSYYKKLNEYLCCFCDCLTYQYVLAKIFEITSVGSLLLVEDKIEKQLNELGFFNNVNCVTCNESNIEEKVLWIMDEHNRNTIDIMRKKGMELTRLNHSTNNRIDLFNNFINSKCL